MIHKPTDSNCKTCKKKTASAFNGLCLKGPRWYLPPPPGCYARNGASVDQSGHPVGWRRLCGIYDLYGVYIIYFCWMLYTVICIYSIVYMNWWLGWFTCIHIQCLAFGPCLGHTCTRNVGSNDAIAQEKHIKWSHESPTCWFPNNVVHQAFHPCAPNLPPRCPNAKNVQKLSVTFPLVAVSFRNICPWLSGCQKKLAAGWSKTLFWINDMLKEHSVILRCQ